MVIPRFLLAGIFVCALAACAGQRPSEEPAECNARPDPGLPQYIVGYGSLMQDESRTRTSPQARPAHPADVEGYRRGWFARGEAPAFGTTYLGALLDRQSRINAVIYQVGQEELAETDRREASYCRARVAPADVTLLEAGYRLAERSEIWIYLNRPQNVAVPDARHPIVQSYVDIFVSGCLEQEQRFGLAGFAQRCLTTTGGWSEHWVNDRIYPRRPFIHQPKARQIDGLLAEALPQYFFAIRLER